MNQQERIDLFSDVISKLRFEPLTREQQHAQLERICELGRAEAQADQRTRAAAAAASALEHRWTALDAHKAEALKMADQMPFRSRAAAALFISSQITKDGPGSAYSPPTIEKWLKAAGWAPSASARQGD